MKCPRCGSENIQFGTATKGGGFSAGKGCCGYILLGPLGLLCGACGSKTTTNEFWVCQKCGGKFTAKEAQMAHQRILNAQVTGANSTINDGGSAYKVVLKSTLYANKLALIKVVREITYLGLKEAKDMVENTPTIVKICETEEEATLIANRLICEGAEVEIEKPDVEAE